MSGLDQSASDEQEFFRETTGGGHAAGALRALSRRIDNTADDIRNLERSLGARLDAIDRTVSAQGQRIGGLERSLDETDERVERHRRVLESKIARDAGVTIPAPSSPELEERRGRGALEPDDFLTPPPIARAIGRAVLRAAEGIPASNPTNARHFETIAKASDEVKAEAEAEPAASADVLALAVQGMIRAVETGIRIGSACETLRSAAERAKVAGVIP